MDMTTMGVTMDERFYRYLDRADELLGEAQREQDQDVARTRIDTAEAFLRAADLVRPGAR